MRKVVSGLFISLDGVVQDPSQWQFDAFDEDMGAAMQAILDSQDSMLLGRATYQEWAAYWPTSTDEPFATWVNTLPKYVVSRTLTQVDWQNSTLVQGDLSEAIGRLKEEEGKTIGVAGSPTLVRSLLGLGLLDQLILMVHPVVAGSGKRLFPDGEPLTRLKLVDSQTTGSGVAILTYEPRQ